MSPAAVHEPEQQLFKTLYFDAMNRLNAASHMPETEASRGSCSCCIGSAFHLHQYRKKEQAHSHTWLKFEEADRPPAAKHSTERA